MERAGDEASARAANGVAQGDGAAVGVDTGHIRVQLTLPGQHHRCERLVDLDNIDIGHGHSGSIEYSPCGIDRTGEHKNWIDAIRTGSKLNCPVEFGAKIQAILSMAEMSSRANRMMLFDEKTRTVKAG